jgi:rhodanese-related sulfurtransferase
MEATTLTPTASRVLAVQPASPPLAARHFTSRLMFQTDPSDLAADLAAIHGADLAVADPSAPGSAADACGCDVTDGSGRPPTRPLVVVDARTPDAFGAGHIPGAVNLPHATIDEFTTVDLDRSTIYVTYCWGPACNASTKAAANLAALGFQVKELVGGLEAWQAEGFPVHTTAAAAVA